MKTGDKVLLKPEVLKRELAYGYTTQNPYLQQLLDNSPTEVVLVCSDSVYFGKPGCFGTMLAILKDDLEVVF